MIVSISHQLTAASATALLVLLAVYMAAGLVVYILLSLGGMERIDSGTKSTPLAFKIIILPGVLVFWPFLLYNLRIRTPRT